MVPHDYRVQKCMQRDGKVQYQNPAQSIQKSYVCSLAYSVDKYYRLQRGMNWFPDEQPSDEIKQQTEKQLSSINWNVDIVAWYYSFFLPKGAPPSRLMMTVLRMDAKARNDCQDITF